MRVAVIIPSLPNCRNPIARTLPLAWMWSAQGGASEQAHLAPNTKANIGAPELVSSSWDSRCRS